MQPAGDVFGGDAAVVPQNHLFHNGKADPRPVARVAAVVKPFEEPGKLLGADAAAVIGKANRHLSRRLLDGNADVPGGKRVLTGVFQQIGNGFAHPDLVAAQRGRACERQCFLRV